MKNYVKKSMQSNYHKLLAIVFLCFYFPTSYAWDGAVSGTINSMHSIPAQGNYDLRITLTNVVSMCTGGIGNFAYLNSNEANFKGVMATLLMAYTAGKTVSVYTTKNAANYCQIGYIIVSG